MSMSIIYISKSKWQRNIVQRCAISLPTHPIHSAHNYLSPTVSCPLSYLYVLEAAWTHLAGLVFQRWKIWQFPNFPRKNLFCSHQIASKWYQVAQKFPITFITGEFVLAGIFWFSITNCQHTHWATKVLHYCGVAKSRHWRARFCAKTRLLDGK